MRGLLLKAYAIVFGLVLSSFAHAADKPASPEHPDLNAPSEQTKEPKNLSLLTLKNYQAKNLDKKTEITLDFSNGKLPEGLEIEAHETFIQVKIPQAQTNQPGEFEDVESPYVKKIVAFQSKEDLVDFRIIVSEDASFVKKATTIVSNQEGGKVLISIDHATVAEMVKNDPQKTAATTNGISANEIIEKNKSDSLSSIAIKPSKFSLGIKNNPKLQRNLINVSIFCAVLLFGLMIFHGIRRQVRRRLSLEDSNRINIKTLATHTFTAKQRIELIEIGGAKILLGISPEQINFLTHFGETITSTAPGQGAHKSPRIQVQQTKSRQAIGQGRQPALPTPNRKQNQVQSKTQTQTRAEIQTAVSPTKKTTNEIVGARHFEARVGDEVTISYQKPGAMEKPTRAMSDVTRLIREKLRDLPSI